jgi:tRNA(Ile)-lysidine synthase
MRRHALCPPGSRVLVALSGGSDSVALTLLLLDLARHGDFTIVGLAHFNHQLRPTADRDQQFCASFAEKLGVPLSAETADVRAYAEANALSLEDAARRLRYDFLERTAAAAVADRIAVGHTEDDQAVTFLLKLMRGAGLTGLAGIYPRRGLVIRPLLETSRLDLHAVLASRHQDWVEDESNEDLSIPRNRVRHRVIPELDRAYGGATRPAIARAAALAREDGQWLDEQAQRSFSQVAVRTNDGVELDVSDLTRTPPPVVRRVLLLALRAMAGNREVSLQHVEAVKGVLEGTDGGVDVPGGRVELRGRKLVLIRK